MAVKKKGHEVTTGSNEIYFVDHTPNSKIVDVDHLHRLTRLFSFGGKRDFQGFTGRLNDEIQEIESALPDRLRH